MLGHLELSFGLVTDWGFKLLELSGDGGSTMSIDNIISPTLIGAMGFKVGPAELELGVGLPFVIVSGDRGPDFVGDPLTPNGGSSSIKDAGRVGQTGDRLRLTPRRA